MSFGNRWPRIQIRPETALNFGEVIFFSCSSVIIPPKISLNSELTSFQNLRMSARCDLAVFWVVVLVGQGFPTFLQPWLIFILKVFSGPTS